MLSKKKSFGSQYKMVAVGDIKNKREIEDDNPTIHYVFYSQKADTPFFLTKKREHNGLVTVGYYITTDNKMHMGCSFCKAGYSYDLELAKMLINARIFKNDDPIIFSFNDINVNVIDFILYFLKHSDNIPQWLKIQFEEELHEEEMINKKSSNKVGRIADSSRQNLMMENVDESIKCNTKDFFHGLVELINKCNFDSLLNMEDYIIANHLVNEVFSLRELMPLLMRTRNINNDIEKSVTSIVNGGNQ